MVRVGRDLKDHLGPTLLPWAGWVFLSLYLALSNTFESLSVSLNPFLSN